MQEDLYDEFGNYLGPELPGQEEQEPSQYPQNEVLEAAQSMIVLNQDKKYYPSHQEVYPGAAILIQQEDTQNLETPIIAPKEQRVFDLVQKDMQAYFNPIFLQELSAFPQLTRNLAIAGALHHGKTRLLDKLVQSIQHKEYSHDFQVRWSDSRVDELQRGISIKCSAVTLILPDRNSKSHLINFLDSPGHPNFAQEMLIALRLADAVLLVVDAAEGPCLMTEKVLEQAIKLRLPLILCISKLDRLILQLKLPPADAYLKLRHIINHLNHQLSLLSPQTELFSPAKGNVLFSSANYNIFFTLKGFSQKYKKNSPQNFYQVLWGDYYFDSVTRKIVTKPRTQQHNRTFVQFVLEPIYKIFNLCLSKEKEQLQPFLEQLQVKLKPRQFRQPAPHVLKTVLKNYIGKTQQIVDAVVHFTPSSLFGNSLKINMLFKGQLQSEDLLIDAIKVLHDPSRTKLWVLARVLAGTVSVGQKVYVHNNGKDAVQTFQTTISGIKFSHARQFTSSERACAGVIVLLQGVDSFISKNGTISSNSSADVLTPIKHFQESNVRVSVQALTPSQMPQMLQNLRKLNKQYPQLQLKVEQSGEHSLLGVGQLYFDCLLHDLRNLYTQVQVKVSDPSVRFSQTVRNTSSAFGQATTANKRTKFSILAKPLDKDLGLMIQKHGTIESRILQSTFNWDIQSSQNVWNFGPSANVLLNLTLPSEVQQSSLGSIKNYVQQGYKWAVREGPLCDQPMRNVRFQIARAQLSMLKNDLTPGQIIPTIRRGCCSSFLLATPKIMEPIFLSQIICTQQCLETVNLLLGRRRAHSFKQIKIPATPLFRLLTRIPIIESFGFQTDLRVMTSGLAFCTSMFQHWNDLQGDPLDDTIKLNLLQPNSLTALGREVMLKTRKRKGLSEELLMNKYFEQTHAGLLL